MTFPLSTSSGISSKLSVNLTCSSWKFHADLDKFSSVLFNKSITLQFNKKHYLTVRLFNDFKIFVMFNFILISVSYCLLLVKLFVFTSDMLKYMSSQ